MASIGEASTFQALINLLKSKFVQKETGKGLFSGSYNDLSDKPKALPASDVYPWAKEASKPTYIPIEVGAIGISQIGIAGGVASLDSGGKVPSSQVDLPTNIATLDGNNKLQDSQTNYVSTGRKSGTTVGNCSTAEGYKTTSSAQYAHAEGNQTHATASAAHAEGCGTQATNQNTHAEGWDTVASSTAAHSEGHNTAASAAYSHAEGEATKAQHSRSHAEGLGTQTGAEAQHVQGKYNIGKSDTAMEIGWGTGDANRINIFEVDTVGNVVANGDIYDGANNKLSDIKSLSKIVNGDEIPIDSTSGDSSLSGVTVTLSRTDANHITATTSDSQTKYFVLDSDIAGEFGLIEAHIHDDGDTRDYYANLLVGDTKTVECNRDPGDSISIDFYTPTGIYNLDVSYDIKAGGDIIDGNGNKLSGKANTSHTHTKSQITDFPASMPASDVYPWAKAATKPSYTASDVGALASNGTAANSSKLGGYSAASSATGNTIALRNGSGYLYATYYNASNGQENVSGYSGWMPAFFDANGWLRKASQADFIANISGIISKANKANDADYASHLQGTYLKAGVTYANQIDCTTNLIIKSDASLDISAATFAKLKAKNGDLSLETTGVAGFNCTSIYVHDTSGKVWSPVYASAFSVQSSRKVKKNIEDMTEEEANKLFELRPVKYDYIDDSETDCYGLIAEEVQDVGIDYPISMIEKKTENEETGEEEIEEIPALDYSKFVPYLIKVCQMQQREIDELKARIGS